jgi:hypothetical protein
MRNGHSAVSKLLLPSVAKTHTPIAHGSRQPCRDLNPHFTTFKCADLIFTGFEPGGCVNRLVLIRDHIGRLMLAVTGATLQIDAVHARAICDEIGDRLRIMLRRQVSHELPPRLGELMELLARLDDDAAPSIVPSIEEMTIRERAA